MSKANKEKEEKQGYVGMVKLGPKGQIVIPKEIRDMFALNPGDSLMIFATPKKGIAMQKSGFMAKLAEAIFSGQRTDETDDYEVTKDDEINFANMINDTLEKDKEENDE